MSWDITEEAVLTDILIRRKLAQDSAATDFPVSTADLARFADTFSDLVDSDVMSQAWQ
jgi:hypothetical protein